MKESTSKVLVTILLMATAGVAVPVRIPTGNDAIFIHGWGANATTIDVPPHIALAPPSKSTTMMVDKTHPNLAPSLAVVAAVAAGGSPQQYPADDRKATFSATQANETTELQKRQYPRIIDPDGYDFEQPTPDEYELPPESCDTHCESRKGEGLQEGPNPPHSTDTIVNSHDDHDWKR